MGTIYIEIIFIIFSMKTITESGTCTIHFTDESEQSKAFNHLAHSQASFKGIDENTIIIKKTDCVALKSKDIHYEEVTSH